VRAAVAIAVLAGCSVAKSLSTSRTTTSTSAATATSTTTSRYDTGPDRTGRSHVTEDPGVSTPQTAAALGGLPGRACTTENEERARHGGLTGPCWDPPGITKFAPMATVIPGMRVMEAPDYEMDQQHATYWFDMPREATLDSMGFGLLPEGDGDRFRYQPFGTGGFALRPAPELVGLPLTEALARLDALDLPVAVTVKWDEHCGTVHEAVCRQDDELGSLVELAVASTIRNAGTAKERRKIPEGLVGRPIAEVTAELRAIGFTDIVVVPKDLPCERGVVCSAFPPGWHPTNDKIELEVRR
jgi:hypothetical protein